MSVKPQILIIDDEADMCWALENILNPLGYKTYSNTSGKEGFEILKQWHQDIKLVFLDAKLPDFDGLKLAARIKQLYPEINIIIITGYYFRDEDAVQQGLSDGVFDGFIGKPFNISEIRTTIEAILP
ncbi:MAG: response regulator [Candidatus Brocadiaceae bacterium]